MELIPNPVIWTHQPIDLAMNINTSCESQGQYHVNLGGNSIPRDILDNKD